MSTDTEHSCLANARPTVEHYDDQYEEPMLSALMGDGIVEVQMTCRTCEADLAVEYEYLDYQER